MKRLVPALLALLLTAAAGPAQASPSEHISTNSPRYVEGEDVVIQLVGYGATLSETIDIFLAGTDQMVAQYYLTDEERSGTRVTWTWDQRHACYGACENVWEGDPAQPGLYEVSTAGSEAPGKPPTRFSIGAYFHVGFEGRPNADFTVFSNQPQVVEQMRAELERPQEERQIVAGIVKARKPGYNPDWKYILGPRSIFLGEVFMEVCDGSPYYVQRHLDEWRGQQWCPWSSYVASEGL